MPQQQPTAGAKEELVTDNNQENNANYNGDGDDDEEEEADEDEEEAFDADDLEFVDDEAEAAAGDDDDEELTDEAEHERHPLEVARDDSVATLAGHRSSVFCVAASPDGCLLASGGEDDRALVWRVADAVNAAQTATAPAVCGGHTDSVVLTAFNKTGGLLATGDLAGRVHVWDVGKLFAPIAEAAAQPIWSGEVAELRWACWHPQVASALLVGAGDGSCWLWQVPSGECKVLPGIGASETTCGLVLPSDPRSALVAYSNGQVRLFDLKTAAAAAGQPPLVCESAVLAMDAAPTSGLAACGTESGQVVCFRAASPKQPLSVCSLPQVSTSSLGGDSSSSAAAAAGQSDNWAVESVQFSAQQETMLLAGCLAGYAFVFNVSGGELRVRLRCRVGSGVVRVLWLPEADAAATTQPTPPRFLTADVGGRVRMWDGLSGEALREWLGHRDSLLDMCVVPRCGLLATCADKCDCTVKLFRCC